MKESIPTITEEEVQILCESLKEFFCAFSSTVNEEARQKAQKIKQFVLHLPSYRALNASTVMAIEHLHYCLDNVRSREDPKAQLAWELHDFLQTNLLKINNL